MEKQNNSVTIKIPDINLDIFQAEPFRAIIYGSSNTGKTYFLANTIYPAIKKRFKEIYVFSQDYNEPKYKKNLNLEKHQYTYKDEKSGKTVAIPNFISVKEDMLPSIQLIRERQSKNIFEKERDEDGGFVYKSEVLLIFDDILDEKFVKDPEFLDIFATFRNRKISSIFLIQTGTVVVSRLMKNNTNIFIIGKLFDPRMKTEVLSGTLLPAIAQYLYEEGYKYNKSEISAITDKIYDSVCLRHKYGKFIVESNLNLLYTSGIDT